MYKTQESKLKMYTFIISEKDPSKDGIGVSFCYNLEDAMSKMHLDVSKALQKFPDTKLIIQHKGTYDVDNIGLEDFMSMPYERKIIKKKPPEQTKVEGLGARLAWLLTYLLEDKKAKKYKNKLTTRDISDLKRIINKICLKTKKSKPKKLSKAIS
jgi:hypothetical protein